MSITVYTKTNCVQCTATTRALDQRCLSYDIIDIETAPKALAHIKSLGYKQAPVITTDTDHWSGFRPDKILALLTSC